MTNRCVASHGYLTLGHETGSRKAVDYFLIDARRVTIQPYTLAAACGPSTKEKEP